MSYNDKWPIITCQEFEYNASIPLVMFNLVIRIKSPDVYVGAGLLFWSANDLLLSCCSCKASLTSEMNHSNILRYGVISATKLSLSIIPWKSLVISSIVHNSLPKLTKETFFSVELHFEVFSVKRMAGSFFWPSILLVVNDNPKTKF